MNKEIKIIKCPPAYADGYTQPYSLPYYSEGPVQRKDFIYGGGSSLCDIKDTVLQENNNNID